MATTENTGFRVVLYEGDGSDRFADELRFEIFSALLGQGYAVTRAFGEDLSDLNGETPRVVIGHFSGPIPESLVNSANGTPVSFQDITGLDVPAVLSVVEETQVTLGEQKRKNWKPWFPVIDFDRCTNCMQCLSFCLFDVYAVDKKEQITVQNQDKCKTDCPACSRVCPEMAILFPKYGKGPINGDEVREADVVREAMKVDISSLLGGDLHSALRTRQGDARKRFSTERDESRALLERKRCLKKLKGALDIPDEVLMSLPSMGDIQERADRAKEKAAIRRERSQTVKDQRPPPSTEDWGI